MIEQIKQQVAIYKLVNRNREEEEIVTPKFDEKSSDKV